MLFTLRGAFCLCFEVVNTRWAFFIRGDISQDDFFPNEHFLKQVDEVLAGSRERLVFAPGNDGVRCHFGFDDSFVNQVAVS